MLENLIFTLAMGLTFLLFHEHRALGIRESAFRLNHKMRPLLEIGNPNAGFEQFDGEIDRAVVAGHFKMMDVISA